jgi:Fe2+ or Zn2+ uptake regulation protein
VGKMKKLTENVKVVYNALVEVGNVAFAKEVQAYLAENGVEKTFNSVNATLSALAGAGYVTKAKAVSGEKMLTQYTVAKELEVAEVE